MRNPLLSTLLEMHTYGRPHGSWADETFRQVFVYPLAMSPHVRDSLLDADGNFHVWVGHSTILWSCHTDTVHDRPARQVLHVDGRGTLALKRKQRGRPACLGADDTVGVFLCRQLILAGIAGHYVFHYGEESGCIGSSALAWESPELLADATIAIAFDRAGTADVITHQASGRTASDAFAWSLSSQLNRAGMAYCPSDRGIYTDTNEYRDLIPECTNVSVGYAHAHSAHECVDTDHVLRLLDAVVQIDQSALVVARDPAVPDPRDRASFGGFSHLSAWPDDWDTADAARQKGNDDLADMYLDAEYADVVRAFLLDHDDDRRRKPRFGV